MFINRVITFLIFLLALSIGTEGQGALVLSPQKVVNLALGKGRDIKKVEWQFQEAKARYDLALTDYDFGVELGSDYKIDQAEQVSGGLSNEEDQTWNYRMGFRKKLPTGSLFNLSYNKLAQKSVLSTFNQNLRPARQHQDVIKLTFEQELLRNSFGKADRAQLAAAKTEYQKQKLQKVENREETVLDSLDLFWKAYIAQRHLEEAMAAREQTKFLVKLAKRKKSRGYSEPGELAQARAELYTQEQRVKVASQDYLKKLDDLLININLQTTEEIEFKIDETLPALPVVKSLPQEGLRKYKIAESALKAAEWEYQKAQSEDWPRLALKAESAFTGVDESTDTSTSEMWSANHPTYFVGLTFQYTFGLDGVDGSVLEKKAAYEIQKLDFHKKREELKSELMDAYRKVQSLYASVQSTLEIVKHRRAAVKEIKKGAVQGRISFSFLVTAFNQQFLAETMKTESIGQYHMALNRLAALQDELVDQYDPASAKSQENSRALETIKNNSESKSVSEKNSETLKNNKKSQKRGE